MTEQLSFWAASFVWRDAMIVAVVCATALAYLGVWVALKEVVYVPLALSQVSSVGVVAAFLAAGWLAKLDIGWDGFPVCDPAFTSFLFALLIAFYFARAPRLGGRAVVVAYLLSSAAVLLLGRFVRQDMHDMQSILFGNAVLVETIQVVYVSVAALLVALIHCLGYRRFLYASFDPDSYGAAGKNVFYTEVLLYVTFAVMISVATRAIGALPAFGLMILPALCGLRLGRTMHRVFFVSMLVGALSAALGYYVSFIWELPTGACMVAVAGLAYLAGRALRTAR